MSLWTTIKDALGLNPHIEPAQAKPFTITKKALTALDALTDASIRVSTEPFPPNRRVRLDRTARGDGPLLVEDAEREHLAGLVLDHDGADFTLHAPVDIHPTETPNPDVRLYETSRFLMEGRPFHAEDDSAPGLAGELMKVEGVKSLLLRDNLVSIEREEGVRWKQLDTAIPPVIRAWFLACGQTLTAVQAGTDDPDYNAVAQVIHDSVLPFVHGHGGDIRLLDVKDGLVTVQLYGACASCPASMLTIKGGVQRQLREQLPDIVHTVEAVEA